MNSHRRIATLAWVLSLLALGVTAMPLGAQTTTGNIRGVVTGDAGTPLEGATIVARNIDVGADRNAITNEQGFYVLAGLRPGRYAITVRRIGMSARGDTLTLLIGQTLTRNYSLSSAQVQLATVTITAAPDVETRTSEIATNVTREQIEQLPTPDRNFMSLAVLAPGVTTQNDNLNGTRKTFSAGAQGPEQVNVFIDGASYKNDILKGGVAGQDASRGNPFPRNAVQEYRVLTQNYKAEYQKASSAIITATTRTGGTEWEGNAFFDYMGANWVELDKFDKDRRNANPDAFVRPDYLRRQFGFAGGGPLSDRLRVFGSFEANRQDRARQVSIVPPSGFPALDTIDFAAFNGKFPEPFRGQLWFGKLTFLQNERSTFDLTYNGRNETDTRDFGGFTAYTVATHFQNKVHTGTLKHTFARGSLLNEALLSGQYYNYNPAPQQGGPINRFYGFGCCAEIGSNRSIQDFTQNRISLRNDLTWSGFQVAGSHVVKGGGNIDFLSYDVVKRNSEIPRFVFEPWYYGFAIPHRVEFQTGDPNFSDNNTQFGLYLQDDWQPMPRLTLNLGVRWDYESNMLNRDYVTPQGIVDSLTKYEDRLFIELDRDRYFTDGSDRDAYLGAIQPRVGLSYAIDQRERTTVFAGWGRYVDRTLFDLTTEESFAQQHPAYTIFFSHPDSALVPGQARFDPSILERGKAATDSLAALAQFNTPEVKLIPNDLRPPTSQQFTAGLRQLVGTWALEGAYTGVRSTGVPTFFWANQNFTCPQRSFGFPDCFANNQIPGFGSILILSDEGKTWYDAFTLKVDRTYRRPASDNAIGWGVGVAYTFAKRESQGYNDDFSFPNPVDYPRQPRNDERHRIVTNFIADMPYLWGIQFSGLITLGSGVSYDRGDRFACLRTDPDVPESCTIRAFFPAAGQPNQESFLGLGNFGYRSVDLRLRKDFFSYRGSRVGVTADLFNVFNYQNFGGYTNDPRPLIDDPDNPGEQIPNPNFARPTNVVTDPRRFQLGIAYDF
jgi:hypothetical protein